MPDVTIFATRCKVYLEEDGQNSFYIDEDGHKTRVFVDEDKLPDYFMILGRIAAKYAAEKAKKEAQD